MSILSFFGISPDKPLRDETPEQRNKRLRYYQWATFISATLGYGLYYVCRLSINVVKKPIVEEGFFTETELGIIGSTLFFSYAIGKFANGFLADHSNIRRFFTIGLFISALANLALGFTTSFIVFAILWAVSGWFQSMGAVSCIIGLTRWFPDNKRGSFYGIWSSSHNIGEALTWVIVAAAVTALGWRWGFFTAGLIGIISSIIIYFFFYDHPQAHGLPMVNQPKMKEEKKHTQKEITKAQLSVLKMPAIWTLALASSFMYVSRYAVNSWGMFYFESQKGYSMMDAGTLLAIYSGLGIFGTAFSGIISDRFFRGSRNVPTLIFGLCNIAGLSIMLLAPGNHFWLDAFAMFLIGMGIGVLLCFLGGLMAVDLAPKNATGAALGLIGIASYIGAGLQDVLSGILIEGNKQVINGENVYDFTMINYFWIGAAVLSVIFALIVWWLSRRDANIKTA